MSGVWSCSTSIRRGCYTSPALLPSVRPSSGWSRTRTSFGGYSLGELCRWGIRPRPRRWGASPYRENRAWEARIPRTSPTTPTGGGTGNGSISGTRWRRRSRHSLAEGQRGGKVGRGALLVGRRRKWRSSRRSSRSSCGVALTGYGCSTPSTTVGLLRWRRGCGRCGSTSARRTSIVRHWRSCRTMRSRVMSARYCS